MRINVKLACSECPGEFYTTQKNKKNTPEKLKLRKYSAKLRRKVEFVEEKL